MNQERRVIVVTSAGRVRGIYTNLKSLYGKIVNQHLHSYSTVSMFLRYNKPYTIGTCVIEGELLEAVTLRRVSLNTITRPII